ncbi:MAG: sigma-70 family RNA polymerase sigma factor [Bacteroidales bacterium]|nr:sigma-70 family RNA polymerase sigma factor [Bacteroidales bacterium]
MKQPLTKEQQELVEKNHNLIYEFAKKKNLVVDEYYGILAIGLCKAASAYDESRGKFSTIAYCCMNNILNEHYRHISKQCAIPEDKILSYDVQLGDEDIDGSYIDIIADDCCVQDIVFNNIMTECIMDKLNNNEKTVATYLINGLKQSEIAATIGCSRQNVGHYVQQIRKKLYKFMNNN